MNYPLYLAYLSAIFLLIATPGPVVAYILHITHHGGAKKAIVAAVGTNAASLVLIAFATLIILGLLVVEKWIFDVVSLIGSFFLLYLAINMLKEAKEKYEVIKEEKEIKKSSSVFLNAFFIGISNPKDIIFFVSFFPQFIHITGTTKTSLSLLIVSWVVFDFMILCAYIFIFKNGFISKYMNRLSRLSALIILLIAISSIVFNLYNLIAFI